MVPLKDTFVQIHRLGGIGGGGFLLVLLGSLVLDFNFILFYYYY